MRVVVPQINRPGVVNFIGIHLAPHPEIGLPTAEGCRRRMRDHHDADPEEFVQLPQVQLVSILLSSQPPHVPPVRLLRRRGAVAQRRVPRAIPRHAGRAYQLVARVLPHKIRGRANGVFPGEQPPFPAKILWPRGPHRCHVAPYRGPQLRVFSGRGV